MLLLVTATDVELTPLAAAGLPEKCVTLLCGVGPVEATLNLSRRLAVVASDIAAVVNFGLAGGYPDHNVDLLDLCLAEREYLGDIGVVLDERIAPLDQKFDPVREFPCDPHLLDRAEALLGQAGFASRRGNFVTVAGCSGTLSRSRYLSAQYGAICENMEGGALARTCQAYGLPFLELRCVSNLVLDRARQVWCVPEATARCGQALHSIAAELIDGR